MRLLNHKVASFSLVEMLVVLVLSGISIGIIYFAYYTLSTYQITLSRKYNDLNDRNTLYFSLKKDIERSQQVTVFGESDLYCLSPHENLTIQYSFSSTYSIRRQAGRVDTFHISTGKPVFLWQG